VVNSAKNDPARKGMGKNVRQEQKWADLPAGIKKGFQFCEQKLTSSLETSVE
jgi:hypothetical protein